MSRVLIMPISYRKHKNKLSQINTRLTSNFCVHKKLLQGTNRMWYSLRLIFPPSSSFFIFIATLSIKDRIGLTMKIICCTLDLGSLDDRRGNMGPTSYSFSNEYSAIRLICSIRTESQTIACQKMKIPMFRCSLGYN